MGIVLGPWNPNNVERRSIARVANIATNVSGIVAVTTDMRQVRHAIADYSVGNAGTAAGVGTVLSSLVRATVLQVSGAVVDVQFISTLSGNGTNPNATMTAAPMGSGLMLSGGILTVWAYGD